MLKTVDRILIVIACCLVMSSVAVLFSIPILQQSSAQSSGDNTWYFGKGAKQDMYLRYMISHNVVNGIPGSSYVMTIYFERYDNNTETWTVPVFASLPNGTVVNATLQFPDKFGLFGLSNSPPIVPHKFEPYLSDYLNTLLDGLVNYLMIPTLLIGGSHVGYSNNLPSADVVSNQSFTTPAGTFHCTAVSTPYIYGCVNKDLPYPVEGYKWGGDHTVYELVEIGHGYPTFSDLQYAQYSSGLSSPLKQFKAGTPASSVKCNDTLQLVIKSEDGSPACVKPETVQKLVERGWGHISR